MTSGGPRPLADDVDPATDAARMATERDIVERWIRLAAVRIADRRPWLTELDAAIGDGDHGINLDRGMRELVARVEDGRLPPAPTATCLQAAGRVIMGTVGGASGALYGRALIRAGLVLGADRPTDAAGRSPVGNGAEPAPVVAPSSAVERAAAALEAAVDGIAALGRAGTGEKTMLDALVPAAVSLRARAWAGADLADALVAAADAAEAGAATTVALLATKGRASYLGPRSVGHLDPGAASSALFLRALADAARGR